MSATAYKSYLDMTSAEKIASRSADKAERAALLAAGKLSGYTPEATARWDAEDDAAIAALAATLGG